MLVADGFLVGTRSNASKLIRVPPEFHDLVAKLDKAVNGTTSIRALCELLEPDYPAAIVADAVEKLCRLGVFELNDAEPDSRCDSHEFAEYIAANADSSIAAISKLTMSRLVVLGHGQVAEASIHHLVRAKLQSITQVCSSSPSSLCPVKVVTHWEELNPSDAELATADLFLASADDPADRLRLFPHVNKLALRLKRPWIACFVEGDEFFLGPLFVPFETGCFDCLEGREEACVKNIDEHRAFKAFVRSNSTITVAHSLPSTCCMAGSALAMEAIRCLSRLTFPVTYETMVQVNALHWDVRHHRLLRMPFCDTCGPHQGRPLRYAWGL